MTEFDEFEQEFDFDEEEFLAEWAEAEEQAAEAVRIGIAELDVPVPTYEELTAAAASIRAAARDDDYAIGWAVRAAGFEHLDELDEVDDEGLVVEVLAAPISMVEDPEIDAEDAATVMALQLADWVAAVLGLVRGGPGAPADPEAVVELIADSPDVDGELDTEDVPLLEQAFHLVLPVWRGAGIVDRDDQLTTVGAWALPRAAVLAWSEDLDLAPLSDEDEDADGDGAPVDELAEWLPDD